MSTAAQTRPVHGDRLTKEDDLSNSKRTVRFKVFRGAFSKWESLFAEAAEYANQIGAERLISISHSDDEVVAVWYWSDDVEHSQASR